MRIIKLRWIALLALLAIVFYGVLQTRATCTPSDIGTSGNDTIICDVNNPPSQGSVEGGDGSDTILIDTGVSSSSQVLGDSDNGTTGTSDDVIIINGSLTDTYVSGDTVGDGGSGNDIIVNNGNSDVEIYGDTAYGNGSGNDTIVNYGTVYGIIGDTGYGDGSGNDTLINNGDTGTIVGDTYSGSGSGNDSIQNNGTVTGSIYGDGDPYIMGYSVSGTSSETPGSDTIENNGLVNGSIYGDDSYGGGTGNDLITNNGAVDGSIVAGGGDDTVVITGSAVVGGVIDGGTGYDVLTFNLFSSDPAQLQEWAAQIAAANPAGGTLTFNGHTYVWQNFEELSRLFISLVRLNTYADPFAAFCAMSGGLDIYAINGSQGYLALSVSVQQISNGLAYAQANGTTVIARAARAVLYALGTGELQVNAPNGAAFTFSYQSRCGDLPAPRPFEQEEVEPDTFIIINRPR